MEGLLFKWHGYLSGWYEQYFVLNSNSLFAYKSQDDFSDDNPAEDYINIGLCEIVVDANETLQWEIKTASSKRWFLKAHVPNEKQKWIQALGSCKACLLAPSFLTHLSVSAGPENNVQMQNDNNSNLITEYQSTSSPSNDGVIIHTETMESSQKKLKHLHPCQRRVLRKCETINGDIATIINLLVDPHNDNESILDFQSLKESLIELINMIDNMQGQCLDFDGELCKNIGNNVDANYCSSAKSDTASESMEKEDKDIQLVSTRNSEDNISLMETKSNNIDVENTVISNYLEDFNIDDDIIKNYSSFFTACTTSFKEVMAKSDVVDSKNLIPTEVFLDACIYFSGLFVRFGKSLLTPLESDVKSNVEKIRTANESTKFRYVQEMVLHEVSKNQFSGPNTGTQALFWINLSLQTVSQFLTLLFSSESETWKVTSSSFILAYDRVLSRHHNWMVQRLFRMGVRMLPDFTSFLASMSHSASLEQIQQNNPKWEEPVTLILTEHALGYARDIKVVSDQLNALFALHNIKQ